MIAKFLTKSPLFPGVRYSTDKVETGKGELLRVYNFGALQGIPDLRPEDYVNYLKAISAQSSRISFPQLHVVISAKGKSFDKHQLAEVAEGWMNGMGYGEHPYLLVFHKDTANHHVHIVSTRIGRDGKKVDDSFERLRSQRVLNQLIGMNEQPKAEEDCTRALAYRFSTRSQFALVLEQQGYSVTIKDEHYHVVKFGKVLATVPLADVDARIKGFERDKVRIHQLRQIVEKYEASLDGRLRPVHETLPGNRQGRVTGYTSELLEFLRSKFGLLAVFHFKDDKPPYGYTWIDQAKQLVLKGGDIKELASYGMAEPTENPKVTTSMERTIIPYDMVSDDRHQPAPHPDEGDIQKESPREMAINPHPIGDARSEAGQAYETTLPLPIPDLNISDDIDDEAILGRNRQRKKQARTNSR